MRFLLLLAPLLPTLVLAQSRDDTPPFKGARQETYKTVGDVELKLWVFEPEGHQASDRRAAIVFFFGGGWKSGNPGQFEQQCRYLASRGMIAITADYRVRNRHETLADKSVADAKSTIRWIREHAPRLGIDPDRIVAGGGSAGGHLAACTGVIEGLDEPGEDLSVSSVPNAMALFNPAVLLAPFDGVDYLDQDKLADIATRTGVPPEKISPIHHVRAGLPPTIIFHGEADDAVPFSTVARFRELSQATGNRCELKGYRYAGHGFFNFGRGGSPGEYYPLTIDRLDRFLMSLGYLQGEPTVTVPKFANVHLRSNFDNSRIEFEREGKGSVAFIGGSITEMNGYRPMVSEFLQRRFPNTEFTFTDAGISSTCSTTGAFRLSRDVLSAEPDLLFVEFAVNDDQDAGHAPRECLRGMEGIIRQARLHNPKIDIVVTHFVNPGMLEILQRGETPISSGRHEAVARHYGVATSDLQREVAERISAGTLTWEEFGGTHPKEPGNAIAASMIEELLNTAWSQPLPESATAIEHRNPQPLDERSYFRGRFVDVTSAEIVNGWSARKPNWKKLPGSSRDRFTELDLLCATESGAELLLPFKGTAVGAYVLAGPDAGTLDACIDGEPVSTVELYHRFSKGLHYPRTVMFATDLDNAAHILTLRVSSSRNEASLGHAVRILEFVAN